MPMSLIAPNLRIALNSSKRNDPQRSMTSMKKLVVSEGAGVKVRYFTIVGTDITAAKGKFIGGVLGTTAWVFFALADVISSAPKLKEEFYKNDYFSASAYGAQITASFLMLTGQAFGGLEKASGYYKAILQTNLGTKVFEKMQALIAKEAVKRTSMTGLAQMFVRRVAWMTSTAGQATIGAALMFIPLVIDIFKSRSESLTEMEAWLSKSSFYQGGEKAEPYPDVYKEIAVLQIAITNFSLNMPPNFNEFHYSQEAERMLRRHTCYA